LLTTPLAQIITFIGRAWFRQGRARVAVRRPALAHLADDLDHYAFRTAISSLPTESRKAALRVLAVDGSITQVRASHWVPGGKGCPHCQLADEKTIHHRLWASANSMYKVGLRLDWLAICLSPPSPAASFLCQITLPLRRLKPRYTSSFRLPKQFTGRSPVMVAASTQPTLGSAVRPGPLLAPRARATASWLFREYLVRRPSAEPSYQPWFGLQHAPAILKSSLIASTSSSVSNASAAALCLIIGLKAPMVTCGVWSSAPI
jgi:hypothetical protein